MADQESEPRYDVGRSLAQGGMGEILEARDLNFGRQVAMKVVRDGRDVSREVRLRFVQEARILSELEHPNIVPVHDLDKDREGRVFYTMKLVRGLNLKQVLDGIRKNDGAIVAKHPLNQLLTVFQKICDAVAYAHSKGIIHRDLKPENVMLGEFGEVWVMDWGLAKVLGEPSQGRDASPQASLESEADSSGFESDSALTMDGQIMGTPQFMAPEQAEGRITDQDARTDILALGGILYSILTLRAPTSGSSVAEVLDNVRTGYIPPPTIYNKSKKLLPGGQEADTPIELRHCPGGRIPDALSAVTMTAMELDPEDRYQSVEELQSEIRAFQSGRATEAEEAGGLRLLVLAVKRNKSVTLAGLLILLVGVVFTLKINATLSDLRKTAPTFREAAEARIVEQRWEDALQRIEEALALQPKNAEFLKIKGDIHQVLFQWQEAATSYRQALQRDPDRESAASNLELSEEMLNATADTKTLDRIRREFLKQGRGSAAIAIANRMKSDKASLVERIKTDLAAKGVDASISDDLEGVVSVVFDSAPGKGCKPRDLGNLSGLPITYLDLGRTTVTNLAPLTGLPLRYLGAFTAENLKDLSPLQGMPLTGLKLSGAKAADLKPLRGMKLRGFYVICNENFPISDLSPLKGMPLETFLLTYGNVTDVDALADAPLRSFELGFNPIASIEGIRGSKKLTSVQISDCSRIRDWSPLRGLPLAYLQFRGALFHDVDVLAGMPLIHLDVSDSGNLKNISALRGMPLETLIAARTRVSDVSPLRGMRLTKLDLKDTPVTDISALAEMPLQFLSLQGCDNVSDVSSLATCDSLEYLVLPIGVNELDALRSHPKLKKLAYTDSDWSKIPDIADFWKAYDARKGR